MTASTTSTSTALVGTRKGLFTVTIDGGASTMSAPSFLGAPVTNAVRDPRDGAVYACLDHGHFGVQAMYLEGDWERAGREFTQAVALDPTYAEAHRFLGIWHDAMGRPAEALVALREA